MKTILLLILLSTLCNAIPARFRFNKNPAGENIKEYRLYQVVDGVKVLKHTHAATAVVNEFVEITIPLEVETGQVWVVTAFNGFESEPSDPVTIPVKPTKPGQFEITLESTEEGVSWIPIAKAIVETDAPTKLFRTKITPIPLP